jgi:putative ABC transport system ATP-binding protein
MSLIQARKLSKIYQRGAEQIKAVNEISLNIETGEFVSFIGPSGSGKTTLLHLLGCLDTPSSGYLKIGEEEVYIDQKSMTEKELTNIRRCLFGYIFQKFYLIPTLTVKENILLPFAFHRDKNLEKNLDKITCELGIEKRLSHLPKEISGGEMQRVSIARAMIKNPKILLADEPTGNLDSKRSMEIAEILSDLNKKNGITIIMVTHNPELAAFGSRMIELIDGKLKG